MAALATAETRLATLILAHNETGVIQPVAELAERLAGLGVPVHTDAVQAVGRVPVDFRALGVATLAASAHKFHGPVGVGFLLVRRGLPAIERPRDPGGGAGRRPGGGPGEVAPRGRRADRPLDAACATGSKRGWSPGSAPIAVVRTGPADPAGRLPQTLHVGFPGLDGDALLMQLDLAGVAASLGSACASGSTPPSPSLVAMGLPADRLRSSVRFSLGADTTEAEIDEAARRIVAVALAVGLAAALEKWQRESAERIARWTGLRDRLEALLIAGLGPVAVVRTGPDDPAGRLPQTLHVGFPGLDGDALLMQLDLAGVAASLGSACASGSSLPSPSLVAMGVPADRLRSSVRFSLGAGTAEAEIDEAARRIVEVVGRIRD